MDDLKADALAIRDSLQTFIEVLAARGNQAKEEGDDAKAYLLCAARGRLIDAHTSMGTALGFLKGG